MLITMQVLAHDAPAKLALIVAQCLSICLSVCLSVTAWVTRMYAALRIASHLDYWLVHNMQQSKPCTYPVATVITRLLFISVFV